MLFVRADMHNPRTERSLNGPYQEEVADARADIGASVEGYALSRRGSTRTGQLPCALSVDRTKREVERKLPLTHLFNHRLDRDRACMLPRDAGFGMPGMVVAGNVMNENFLTRTHSITVRSTYLY